MWQKDIEAHSIQLDFGDRASIEKAYKAIAERFGKLDIWVNNEGLNSGVLKPVIDSQIFSLNNIVEAHRYIESNQQNGKIIVTV